MMWFVVLFGCFALWLLSVAGLCFVVWFVFCCVAILVDLVFLLEGALGLVWCCFNLFGFAYCC